MIALDRRMKLIIFKGITSFLSIIKGTNSFVITYPQQETSGAVSLADNIAISGEGILSWDNYPGPELLSNRFFENWSGTPPDDQPDAPWNTTETTSNGYVTENPANTLQMISDGTLVQIRQDVLTVGKRYRSILDMPAASGTISALLGNTQFNHAVAGTFIDEGNCTVNNRYVIKRATAGNWTVNEVSCREANPLNGDDIGTSITATGNFHVPYMKTYDGLTSYTELSASELTKVISNSKGSILVLGQVDASFWTDSASHFLLNLYTDANNNIGIRKTAGNALIYDYDAGGTPNQVGFTPPATPNLFCCIMTYDVDAGATGELIGYFNGAKQGATVTGLGTYVGDYTKTFLGAFDDIPTAVFDGNLAYNLTYFSDVLTQAQIDVIINNLGIQALTGFDAGYNEGFGA